MAKLSHFFLFLSLVVLLGSCNGSNLVTIQGKTMGTTYTVKYFGSDSGKEKYKTIIDNRLIEINQAVSTYIKDSEISQLNNNHVIKRRIILSDDLFLPLESAYLTASLSKGAFDPTIGPLVSLWGFGPEGDKKVPSQAEINLARKKVGYKNIYIDPLDFSLVKLKKDIYLDLSATAKGYGVDEISELLLREGFKEHMVEIGGEIKVEGKKNEELWSIGIEAPHPNSFNKSIKKIIKLFPEMAMATSGNYRNFFEESGKRYSHTIDHKTGKPVSWIMASVTVIELKSCMKADSWATTLMALGPVKGMELAEKYKIAAYFIYSPSGKNDEKFVELKSSQFDKVLAAPKED